MNHTPAEKLALEIASCPIVDAVLKGAHPGHPCTEVVEFQRRPREQRWVPEPWSGHLGEARLLILSSNPSSGKPGEAPSPNETVLGMAPEEILRAFEGCFDDGDWPGIMEGEYHRNRDRQRGAYEPYWHWAKAVASELFDREAAPGRDYALTEVVHCGSTDEAGVWRAAMECVPRYLNRVLELSPAPVLVIVGAVARDMLRATYPLPGSEGRLLGPVHVAGRQRTLVYLMHPNAFGPKTVNDHFKPRGAEVLQQLRRTLGTAAGSDRSQQ